MNLDMDIEMWPEGCGNDTDVIEDGGSVCKDANEESIDGFKQTNKESGSVCVDFDSDQCKPYVGMEFKSEKDAYRSYNMYAKRMRFGVRRGKVYLTGPRQCITARRFLCAKEGFKGRDKQRMENALKPRREIREGWKAMMGIRLTEANVWSVKSFIEEHTHDLVTPSKTAKIRSHKTMLAATNSLINSFYQSMGSSQIVSTLTTLDMSENVIVTPQDTRSYLKKYSKE